MFGGAKTPAPPPPPPPPPNAPTYASSASKSPSSAGPLGGLASTILTSPAGVLQPAGVGKTLLGG
jgi:hypothetical protein